MGIIKIALENTIPYISNIEKIKENIRDFSDCNEAIRYLEELIKEERNPTLRTDYKIILNYVRKICSEKSR